MNFQIVSGAGPWLLVGVFCAGALLLIAATFVFGLFREAEQYEEDKHAKPDESDPQDLI